MRKAKTKQPDPTRLFIGVPSAALAKVANRTAKALHTAYSPRAQKWRTQRIADALAERTSFTPQELERDGKRTYHDILSGETRISREHLKGFRTTLRNSELRGAVAHEMSHALHLSRNNYVTAQAIDVYFGRIVHYFRNQSHFSRAKIREESFALIDEAYSKRVSALTLELEKQLEKQKRDPSVVAELVEHRPVVMAWAFSEIGNELGLIAATVDAKLRKPGAGLFLIREVSQGRKVAKVLRELKGGKFDGEIQQWLGKNPAIRALLKKEQP